MLRRTRFVLCGFATLMALSTRAARTGRIARIARMIRAARFGFMPCKMRAARCGLPLRIARSTRSRLSLGLRRILGMLIVSSVG